MQEEMLESKTKHKKRSIHVLTNEKTEKYGE